MAESNFSTTPHRRLNLLTGEWVLVSPHRTARPWQGQVEPVASSAQQPYDPACYLCPGNERAGGHKNPDYEHTFVFTNDYAALLPNSPAHRQEESGLLIAEGERGECRVVCFSPRHDLTLADMEAADIRRVVDLWAEQYRELAGVPWVRHVQIFENRGAMMGASNPHPHGQIWAEDRLPNEAQKELTRQVAYLAEHDQCLLCDYLQLELEKRERIVCENDSFVSLVPYWALWPYETLLLSRRHAASIDELNPQERDDLADILRRQTRRYNQLFQTLFPYSMGFHQKPTDGAEYPALHLHAHFYPPLLRSATIRKFMVGYEMLGQPQRDLTPESAAETLRALPEA